MFNTKDALENEENVKRGCFKANNTHRIDESVNEYCTFINAYLGLFHSYLNTIEICKEKN